MVDLRDDRARLSKEEIEELESVLGDGFTSVLLISGEECHPVSGVFEEPFWGANVSLDPSELSRFKGYCNDLRELGFSDEELMAAYLESIELDKSDDAPSWFQSNPFSFDIKKVEAFFVKRCDDRLGEDSYLHSKNGGSLSYGDFVAFTKPYSISWFEFHIAQEFWILRAYFNDIQKQSGPSSFWMFASLRRASVLGRMIENYRWRFAYGDHALRGRKVVEGAESGGRERAQRVSEQTAEVLQRMLVFRARGHSISRAAELTFESGIGSSGGANRAIWYRRQRRKL